MEKVTFPEGKFNIVLGHFRENVVFSTTVNFIDLGGNKFPVEGFEFTYNGEIQILDEDSVRDSISSNENFVGKVENIGTLVINKTETGLVAEFTYV